MAFRLLDQFPQYCDAQNVPLAGGYLALYETGTTTPKDAYGDRALSVNIGSTVALDSSGRTNTDVWLDGDYRVRLYDADDVLVDEAENVELPGGEASALPSGNDGQFLSLSGGVPVFTDITTLPDPTGAANKILGTDGATWFPIAKPADGAAGADPDIIVAASSFQAGVSTDETKFLIQTGTGTAPVVAGVSTSVSVTFPTPYATLSHVGITPTVASVSGTGSIPVNAVTGYTPGSAATAVTVNFRNPSDGDIVDSGDFITTPVAFTWIAFGTVEVPA